MMFKPPLLATIGARLVINGDRDAFCPLSIRVQMHESPWTPTRHPFALLTDSGVKTMKMFLGPLDQNIEIEIAATEPELPT